MKKILLFSLFLFIGVNYCNASTTTASQYILMDQTTGRVIKGKNYNSPYLIASITKIMTCLLAIESNKIDDVIEVDDTILDSYGSGIYIEVGEQISIRDLLYGLMLRSGNDAALMIAKYVSNDVDSFVLKMNEKAKKLGMINTNYENPHGLDSENHYTSARDMAIVARELVKHKKILEYSSTYEEYLKKPDGTSTWMVNTNKLIRFYNGCDCGKTGYTNEAGHCLVASAIKNGMRLISVVISSPDSKTRFNEVSSMFNYGFSYYTNKLVVDNNKPLDLVVKIDGGKKDSIEIIAEKPFYVFTKKDEKRSVELNFVPFDKNKAPIRKGDVLGELHIYENGIQISTINVLANEDVNLKTYFDVICDIGENWGII